MTTERIKVLAICGNTRPGSVNEQVLLWIANRFNEKADFRLYNDIGTLPHFRSDSTGDETPGIVKEFYEAIDFSDAVIICSPEYVYSLPGSIKNAIDWTVSTTLFTNKPLGLIVASLGGEYAAKALKLIMATLGATIEPGCEVLIQSIKTKIDKTGKVINEEVIRELDRLMDVLRATVFAIENQ